jgi:hypothetical protein
MPEQNQPDPLDPPPFPEYAVAGVGTVIAHADAFYHVRTADGRVVAYRSPSGAPAAAAAPADIAWAIANPPPLPVPDEVPAWRIKAVAKLAGLEPAITAALGSLAEPARTVAAAAWYEGNVIRRDSATVNQLAAALGIPASEMDEMFRQAASIEI